MKGEFKKIIVEVVVLDGEQDRAKSLITERLVDKMVSIPENIRFVSEEDYDMKAQKLKHIVIASKKVEFTGANVLIRRNKSNNEDEKAKGKWLPVKYDYEGKDDDGNIIWSEQNNTAFFPVDIDDPEDAERIGSYLGSDWMLYNAYLISQKSNDLMEIVVGDLKPGKFAINFIEKNLRKVFDIFLEGKLEKTSELFEKKRNDYMKYFIRKIGRVKEKERVKTMFKSFAEATISTFIYRNLPEYRKEVYRSSYIVFTDKELKAFTNLFVERITHKDVVEIFDLGEETFKITNDNVMYMNDFYCYFYKKFGLLNKEEVDVILNPDKYPPFIYALVFSNIDAVAKKEKKHRIKADSWCYHIFNYCYAKIKDMNSLYNDRRIDRQKFIYFTSLILNRYAVIKEFRNVFIGNELYGDLLDDIIPLIHESLDNIKGLEKLTLTSIVNSNPKYIATTGSGIRKEIVLFENVPDEFKTIRKTILEVKLKR